jgi:Gnt-I system high-affinity gluconate transporter
MPLVILAAGILFLFFLIVKVRLNSFLSLLLVAGLVGFAEGLPEGQIIPVIEKGLGAPWGVWPSWFPSALCWGNSWLKAVVLSA